MDNQTHAPGTHGNAVNAWGEPPEPNPVLQIIGVRTLQVGGAAGVLLAALAAVSPPSLVLPVAIAGGVAVTTGLSLYFAHTFHPRTTFSDCPLLVHLPQSPENTIAITFDDGPHPNTTPPLLDTLASANAKATFFLVGERATRYPHLVRRIQQEGHTIGIHGLHHRTMVLQNATQIERDLEEAVTRIENAAGTPLPRPLLLRPPYGFKTNTLSQTAKRLGVVVVSWSLDPRDYTTKQKNQLHSLTEQIQNTLEKQLAPGAIILLHENPTVPAAVQALPKLLTLCQKHRLTPIGLDKISLPKK